MDSHLCHLFEKKMQCKWTEKFQGWGHLHCIKPKQPLGDNVCIKNKPKSPSKSVLLAMSAPATV